MSVLLGCTPDDDYCDCRLWKEVKNTELHGYRTLAPEYVEDYYIDDCDLDGKSIDKWVERDGSLHRVFLICE